MSRETPSLLRTRGLKPCGLALIGLLLISSASQAETDLQKLLAMFDTTGQETLSLTLAEVLERAVSRPQARAAQERAKAAEMNAETVRRETLWPLVQVDASLNARDRDFEFDTPLGAFTLGDSTSTAGNVSVIQPILDPAERFHALPAAQHQAESARQSAGRTRQSLRAEAAQRFLDVLANQAQIRATESFIESLEARLSETAERVDAGRSLESDAIKVKLDLQSAILDLTTLRMARGVLLSDLGRVIGHPGLVEPDFDGPYDLDLPLELNAWIDRATAGRPDLLALTARRMALEERAAAERATRLPRLEAGANWAVSDGDPFQPDELIQGSLNVRWTPFRSKTRQTRRAALTAEAEAITHEIEELRRLVTVEIQLSLAQLAQSRATVAVRQTGIELAAETSRVERERYQSGRSTANDLLDAEAALRRQRTDHALAQIEVLRAWIRLTFAVGDDTIWPGGPGEETGS